ncbi:MAG: ABC transporter permease [Candidatus Kariarchaeaceae archaeon]|jgi:ABC-type tungstate transport system substrate-binding protein/ABC-type multidrug transport system ATPase subunit
MSTFTDGFINAIELIIRRDPEVVDITLFSFQLSLSALFLAILVGLPLGLLIGLYDFFGKRIIVSITYSFTGFPPVTMGVFLFVLLSRTGPLGTLELLYTPRAMLLAQFFLALPIIMSTTIQAVSILPDEFFETLSTLNVTGIKRRKILVLEIRSSLMVGAIIGFGRAISEVGAILILGGNIRWSTRTLTTASVLEISRGSPEMAIALGIILLFISFLVNIILQVFQSSLILPQFASDVKDYKIRSSKTTNGIDQVRSEYYYKIKQTEIEAVGISKQYNSRKILEGTSLNFEPGKIYAVIGPNGVGKTTLLRILSNIESDFTGTVTQNPRSNDIPYLHQTPYMLKGNVLSNLKLSNPDETFLEDVIGDFGLADLLKNDANKLSGGEKRRVAIARLILTRSNYLIMDETTSDLDPAGVARIENIVQSMRDFGGLIVMTTHNLLQARRIADKVILILDPQKIFVGDAQEIFDSDNPEIKSFIDGTLPW